MKRKKWYWEDKWCLIGLAILAGGFCWLFAGRFGVFGSKVDWISQHSVFPEYFRQQFYETGRLFPEFAPNIGGGQNIYNFAYYGLYSPIVLFSYFFPFVKMEEYLMAASVAGLTAAVLICYKWLRRNRFSVQISFCVSLYFLLAGPMIYHSYNQVMFVNYMPFLCLALIGVDRYFESGKSGLYAISVFLMIMTSFYFSVGGMMVLVLYGLHRYFQKKEKGYRLTCGKFLWDGIRFLCPMMTAVCMSGILLAPTVMALVGGRDGNGEKEMLGLKQLLVPKFLPMRMLYSPYGVGLTALFLVILLTGLTYRNMSERILTWGCVIIFSVPLFCYLLNGGLYIRDKVLIPFLPLICYLAAVYFQKQEKGEITVAKGTLPALAVIVLLIVSKTEIPNPLYRSLFILDGVAALISILVFYRKRTLAILAVSPVLCLFLVGNVFHNGKVLERDFYEDVTGAQRVNAIQKTLDQESGFYRTEEYGNVNENAANLNRVRDGRQYISSVYSSVYNRDYQKFRTKVFQLEEPYRNFLMQSAAENPIYRKVMGIRYVVKGNEWYCDEDVAPVVYATDRLISEDSYRKLKFPYNQIALADYAVVKETAGGVEGWKTQLESEIRNVQCEIPEHAEKNKWKVRSTENGYKIQAEEAYPGRMVLKDDGQASGKRIFYLQFQVKNEQPEKDVAIKLEGVRNKLTSEAHTYYNGNTTFTWAVPLAENQQEVHITFGKGVYEITDIQAFISPENIGAGKELYQSALSVDWEKTKGNRIQGMMKAENVKQVVTSIPYDENFEVKVDGERVPYEKVNTAFLGFLIGKGTHEVEIIYHAPGVVLGRMMSVIGILALLLMLKKGTGDVKHP